MGRTATSRRGRIEGYILLDALLAIFLSAALAAAILPGLSVASRRSMAQLGRAQALVEARNSLVMEHIDDLAP
jgi:type II secretory pathway component PulJ